MTALYRYLLISVLLSQRYLPPTLIFLAAMAVGTTSDSGPLESSYAFCVLAMLVCTTWLTVSIVNHEDPTQRKITLVMIGSSLRLLAITAAAAILAVLLLRWLSPIRPLMSLLSTNHPPADNAVPLTLLTALSAAILAAAVFATRMLADRRD